MSKTPEYLKFNEGSVDITLASAATIVGVKQSTIRMREPTVNDQLVADAIKGTDGDKELAVLSNLLDISQDDLKAMTLRNYKRIQTAYVSFTD